MAIASLRLRYHQQPAFPYRTLGSTGGAARAGSGACSGRGRVTGLVGADYSDASRTGGSVAPFTVDDLSESDLGFNRDTIELCAGFGGGGGMALGYGRELWVLDVTDLAFDKILGLED